MDGRDVESNIGSNRIWAVLAVVELDRVKNKQTHDPAIRFGLGPVQIVAHKFVSGFAGKDGRGKQ